MKGMMDCGKCGKRVRGRMIYFGGAVFHPKCAAGIVARAAAKKLKSTRKTRTRKNKRGSTRRK